MGQRARGPSETGMRRLMAEFDAEPQCAVARQTVLSHAQRLEPTNPLYDALPKGTTMHIKCNNPSEIRPLYASDFRRILGLPRNRDCAWLYLTCPRRGMDTRTTAIGAICTSPNLPRMDT